MHISRLSLTNFRNYRSLELELPPGVAIVHGDNAQGKTNLLEAIYLLATTRSHRATAERELIHWSAWGEPPPLARVASQVQRSRDRLQIEIFLIGQDVEAAPQSSHSLLVDVTPDLPVTSGRVQRRIKVNGLPRNASSLVGQVKVVMFTSQDIDLVAGAPALRRRYLDVAGSQLDSRYLRALQRYSRVLLQRNHLLRLIQEQGSPADQIEFWDSELAEQGSYIVAQRRRILGGIEQEARALHDQISDGRERLALMYLPAMGDGARESPPQQGSQAEMRQALLQALGRARSREMAQGMTIVGPHRDDLRFMVNGVNMGTYGSRGQQRSLAVSLKLAEARYIFQEAGERPILLLDDVFSELDKQRRAALLQAISGLDQVLITATDLAQLDVAALRPAAYFQVRQGELLPSEG